jgi:two-component system sensor histidine kinase BarA
MKLMPLRLGLKHHILLLTIIPSLLMTAALTAYFVVSRQADAQHELIRQMSSSIEYLSKSSELGLFTGDKSVLAEISRSIRANEDVKSVKFYDSENQEVLREGGSIADIKADFVKFFYKKEFGSQWLFQSPVYSSNVEVADFPALEEKGVPIKLLGWVQIIADKSRLKKKQRSILLAGSTIGLIGFFLVALLALKFSNSITLPLEEITKTVKQLELGNLAARVSVTAKGEMDSLVQGINQLSEKVEISNDSLQKRVDTAVATLTQTLNTLEEKNEQLENTGAELIEANKIKDDFLASISHELRTPLTAILGYSQLLEKTNLQIKQANHVGVIHQASTMLLALIDNILDFSKLKSESIELENVPFNLETLLDEIVDLHQPEVDDKGINIRVIVEIDVPLNLLGDVFRIKQVINNLVRNAIKFTSEGSVSITVSLLQDTNNSGLVFTIKDSGIGMDSVDVSHLFQSFSQADSSISRRFGGTGLGLVISKQLVDLLGGEISVNSWKGKGTEVIFSVLNIEEQSDFLEIEDTSFESSSILNSSLLSNVTILVAEDNLFIKQLLKTILESEGATVISVENGIKAVKKCQEYSIDLVILDYHMPVLDGLEASKLIRKSFSSETLPIILITADVLNTRNVDTTGIDKVIHKPINESELIKSAARFTSKFEPSGIPKKVLDYLPDDIVFSEISRLYVLLKQASEANQSDDIKRYAHEICGIAGPSSKYGDINMLMRKIEQYIEVDNYGEINTLLLNSRGLVG